MWRRLRTTGEDAIQAGVMLGGCSTVVGGGVSCFIGALGE